MDRAINLSRRHARKAAANRICKNVILPNEPEEVAENKWPSLSCPGAPEPAGTRRASNGLPTFAQPLAYVPWGLRKTENCDASREVFETKGLVSQVPWVPLPNPSRAWPPLP